MNISDLNLSCRAYNCLKHSGINTTEDLCDKTPEDMMRVRNLGRRCLEEVLEIMKSRGLQFRESTITDTTTYKHFNIICSDGYTIKVEAESIEIPMGIVSLFDADGTQHEVMRVAEIKEGDYAKLDKDLQRQR
jgi:hypothetical protein